MPYCRGSQNTEHIDMFFEIYTEFLFCLSFVSQYLTAAKPFDANAVRFSHVLSSPPDLPEFSFDIRIPQAYTTHDRRIQVLFRLTVRGESGTLKGISAAEGASSHKLSGKRTRTRRISGKQQCTEEAIRKAFSPMR